MRSVASEWPLVLFTVLAPLCAGIWMVAGFLALIDAFPGAVNLTTGYAGAFLCVLLLAALACSTLHLGKPLKALRAFMRLGNSSVSNEVFVGALFALCSCAYVLVAQSLIEAGSLWKIPLAFVAGFAGLFVLFQCLAYRMRTVSTWNSPSFSAEFAVFALLAGTATTFSLATPLMSQIAADLLGIDNSKWITILILVITCIVYTFCVVRGMHGIMKLAASCVYLFFGLLAYVLIFGGETRYIIETGFSSIGNLIQNFVSLSTFTDPQRTTSFPQNWTIFYWAYWMVWCVAAPFFIGNISKGRTVKQTILGGYIFGLGGTFTSFIILGNYSLGLQVFGKLDVIGLYTATGNLYTTIIAIVRTLPLAPLVLILLALTMIAFYATSFDAIALVASSYSYKELDNDEEPHMGIKVFWSIMLILLPIALVFSDNSMANLQTVSIIAAFPIAVIIVMIIVSFFKDAKKML